jgi:4-hydroxybenzoate polyprenyltransferase
VATSRAVRGLLLACHPGPTLAVTVLTALLAGSAGHAPARGALVTAAVLTGQLSIGWSNDLVDARRDRAVGRTDKPVASGEVAERVVRVACGVALVACAALSLACGWAAGLVHLLLGVASGWAYNLWFKRTVLSPLPYAVAFGTLPAVVTLALPSPALPPGWVVATGALLGVGAHLLNALPDLADDVRTGVRGLPHRLGATASAVLGAVLLGGASLLLVLGPPGTPTTAGWAGLVLALPAVVLAALAGTARWRRLAFPAVMLLTVLDVVLLLAGGAAVT